jgi:hypothetical protein
MTRDEAPPAIPTDISPDGREIWQWAEDLAGHCARADKIRTLKQRTAKIGTRCGDCANWMTKSCPKERPGTGKRSGYSVGPSCNDSICSKFALKDWSRALRAELQDALKKLEEERR